MARCTIKQFTLTLFSLLFIYNLKRF